MGSLATPPQVVEDCFGVLKLYSDGSIVRSPIIDYQIPINDDGSVVWKDSLFDKNHGLYLRLFKPTTTTNPSSSSSSSSSPNKKLPIVFYIHGGGFCLGSRSFANFHNTCHSLAFGLKAIVVSPDYRLAPEHRLPAAIEDVYGALKWVQDQAVCESPDEWVCGDEVEFDNVFILGDSSGGNVAHHLAVRIRPGSEELKPVQIRGYVLLSPFFGGAVLTKSEEERACEEFWNLDMYDRFWRLSLPEGATKDHPLSNPFGPSKSLSLKDTALDPILVVVGGGEILRDRVEDYARRLKEFGKKIDYVEFEGKEHGFFTTKSSSEEAKGVMQIFIDFMSKNSSLHNTSTIENSKLAFNNLGVTQLSSSMQ
ncbi:probable carboxylesterase 15 [Camellia sinensis]|uniref:probable carboxylesterase 15 n=1 Tax=Camellia sinensis TaxID=4442 RepID=UPI00103697B0|nr:probable carboxylesterase 15 [Camellia sinensis]